MRGGDPHLALLPSRRQCHAAAMRAPLITAVALLLSLAGCSSGQTPAEPTSEARATIPTGQPKTEEAARAAAKEEFDAYAAGDWGGTWDLWTQAGQKAFSREDYIALHNACKTPVGIPLNIQNVRLEGDSAIVRIERMTLIKAYTMKYENGEWRFQPEAEDMAGYAKGKDALIAERCQ